MPAIRIMNWNIRKMSNNKLNIAGMTTAIANTVVGLNVDVLIILEVTMANRVAAMTALSNALNGGGGNDWTAWFLSHRTGDEYYGIFIRNLDMIRPAAIVNGPPPPAPQRWGSRFAPLSDLKKYTFEVWPWPNFAVSAYPVAPPANRPQMPLVVPYSSPRHNRDAKRERSFAGQPAQLGGYSQGRGYRLPMMAMFWIHTGAGDYLVPVVACHYAAAAYQGPQQTILARDQIGQLKELHISQMFNSDPTGLGGHSEYLDFQTPGAHIPVRVEELCFTGDFNVDFLVNRALGDREARLNRHAYGAVTPTEQQGGSIAGNGAPGAPGPVPAFLPYPGPFLPGPEFTEIENQRLHTAATSQGTILRRNGVPMPVPVAPPPAPWVSACFDNFIYGGTHLGGAAIRGNNDSANVVNTPENVVTPGEPRPLARGRYDVGSIAAYYALRGKWNAALQPNLQSPAVPPPALTNNDRFVGANMVSDHLPVFLEFDVP